MTLSLKKVKAVSRGYYTKHASEDYYLDGEESVGQWFGRGAEALGLRGPVRREDFELVCAGKGPDGRPLAQEQVWKNRSRVEGVDATWSAPKYESVLYALGGRQIRQQVLAAVDVAADAGLHFFQSHIAITRRGGGGRHEKVAGLVVAKFLHHTSRAQDPQLHVHAYIANLAWRRDDSWGTIEPKALFRAKMAAGALFRASLREELVRRLGIEYERTAEGLAIRGIPQDVVRAFSKRRQHIEQQLDELGSRNPKLAEHVALRTRPKKAPVSREELFSRWREEAASLGYTFDEAKVLRRITHLRPDLGRIRSEAKKAVSALTVHQATFTDASLVETLAARVEGGGFKPLHILSAARRELASKRVRLLGNARGVSYFTTTHLHAIERRLLSSIEQTRDSKKHLVRGHRIEKAAAAFATLSDEQRRALSHIAGTPGQVSCLTGIAGTGKTFVLRAARALWEREGFNVIGCSLTRRATKELEKDSGIQCKTVARLLYEFYPSTYIQLRDAFWAVTTKGRAPQWKSTLGSKSILVVDEAGLLDTVQMEKLLRKARRAGAKVVLVGDARQLQPIGPGGPFLALSKRLGDARLTEVRRQEKPWLADVVRRLERGDSRAAILKLAEEGHVTVAKSRDGARAALVDKWFAAAVPVEDRLVVAATRDAMRKLNIAIQARRLSNGELGINGSVPARDTFLFPGDRVTVRVPEGRWLEGSLRAEGVCNGDRGTVERASVKTLRVRMDSGRKVDMGRKEISQIELGYASTVFRVQSVGAKVVLALLGTEMNDLHTTYVAISRAKQRAEVFLSREDAGPDLERFIEKAATLRQKQLAMDVESTLRTRQEIKL